MGQFLLLNSVRKVTEIFDAKYPKPEEAKATRPCRKFRQGLDYKAIFKIKS